MDLDIETIYRAHYKFLYASCLKFLHNKADAEDMVQQTFMQVMKKGHTFEGRSNIRTWLWQIARNQCLMLIRWRLHGGGRQDDPMARLSPTTIAGEFFIDSPGSVEDRGWAAASYGIMDERDPDPEKHILDRIAIEEAALALAPGYRSTLYLHDVVGYDHPTVGKMLGSVAGTSKSQLSKARNKMRKLLRGEDVKKRVY